jgi:hypothetical protein
VQDGFYGHPYLVGPRIPRPEFAKRPDIIELANKTTPPALNLPAHWACLGFTFIEKDTFGADHIGDIFVASHGSWNSLKQVGACVERVFFDKLTGKPIGHHTIVDGFNARPDGVGTGQRWARPVDLVEAPDGTILFTSDDPDLGDLPDQQVHASGGSAVATNGDSPHNPRVMRYVTTSSSRFCPSRCSPTRRAHKPRGRNIVLFIADDFSWHDSEPYGATDVRTPNMTALAKEGMRFDRAIAAAPTCTPSRSAIFTGLYRIERRASESTRGSRKASRRCPITSTTWGIASSSRAKTHIGPREQFLVRVPQGLERDAAGARRRCSGRT